MGNHFCVHAVCGVDVPFAKGFCRACEADIQEYTSAQNIFTGIFLHTIYYYGEGGVQQPLFRYRLRAIFVVNLINLENANVLFCCITHHTSHIIYLKEIQ